MIRSANQRHWNLRQKMTPSRNQLLLPPTDSMETSQLSNKTSNNLYPRGQIRTHQLPTPTSIQSRLCLRTHISGLSRPGVPASRPSGHGITRTARENSSVSTCWTRVGRSKLLASMINAMRYSMFSRRAKSTTSPVLVE